MKSQLRSLVGLLLPLIALAAPAADAALETDLAEEAASLLAVRDISPEALGLVKRSTVRCYIINSSSATVNCRSGPGFDYGAVGSVTVGKSYPFNCYKTGDCYQNNW
jgi:uncharacterized protein YraI